jgi:hypothetical protein
VEKEMVWSELSLQVTVTVMFNIVVPGTKETLYCLEKMVPEIVPSLWVPTLNPASPQLRFLKTSKRSWAEMEAWVILLEKKLPLTEVICIPAMAKSPKAKMTRPIRTSMSVNPAPCVKTRRFL